MKLLFLLFSLAALSTAFRSSQPDPLYTFLCLGMVVLSVSRYYGVRHVVPAPELIVYAYPFCCNLFIKFAFKLPLQNVDRRLLLFDYNFGFCETIAVRLYNSSFFSQTLLGTAYCSLMLVVVCTYLAVRNSHARKLFLIASASTAILIWPLYLLCPAGGPKYLADSIQGINAMPSGHFAWALLIWWFTRKHCGVFTQALAGVFVMLTFLATLGAGEHYVVDLIVAVPFAACVWMLVHQQWKSAAVSMLTALVWIVMLREAWALSVPPILVWILTGVTVSFFSLHAGAHRIKLNSRCADQLRRLWIKTQIAAISAIVWTGDRLWITLRRTD